MSKLKKALEKAKEARQNGQGLGTELIRPDSKIPTPDHGEAPPPTEAIKPSYRQTTILEIDPLRLKKNKIISWNHQDNLSEQIRFLRTRVMKRLRETGGNSLLLTSPNPNEGKTLVAINLAVSMAHEINRTILLVDADLRKPSVHKYFGFKAELGLADYLLGEADIPQLLINPGIDKLTILPGGKPLRNSTELLGAPRMEALVKEMKSRYPDRYLVFDSSPVLTCADPIVFSGFIDGVILVIEAEKTKRKDLQRTMELLKDKPVMGTVMNKLKGDHKLAYV